MNSKRTIMILILVLTIGIVGLTIAYFANSSSVDNVFTTQPYGTTVTENFTSPSNWLPGDTTNKTVVATNSGNVDEAVRISLSESWVTANHGTLNGWITINGNKSSHLPENEPSTDERVAIINFDNTSDWTYSNGYYYYNYKLSPNESTSSLIKSVTFNSKTKLDDTCVETPTATGRTITCESSGDDYDNATYTLTFNIETVQYNKYMSAWGTDVAIAEEKASSGVDTLLANNTNVDGAAYNDTTKSKMFKMSHPATAQTPAQTEYRYIGDNPNNYVYFNCDSLSNQSASTCEVWRIIGVFDVDDGTGNYEQRIKLVRGSALPDTKVWDNRTSEMYPNNNNGKNEWVGSVMQTYLNDNGDYYKRTGTASTYGLKENAKTLISDAKYYLGGATNNNGYGTADAIYLWERGTNTFNYENYCSWDTNNSKCTTENYCENNPTDEICTATRNKFWVGEVALMYPSDQYLVYANGVDAVCYSDLNNCYFDEMGTSGGGNPTEGWIYNSNNLQGQNNSYWNWFVSPNSDSSNFVFGAGSVGRLGWNDGDYDAGGARPVVYLKSEIKITEGTGESTNPFKLGL